MSSEPPTPVSVQPLLDLLSDDTLRSYLCEQDLERRFLSHDKLQDALYLESANVFNPVQGPLLNGAPFGSAERVAFSQAVEWVVVPLIVVQQRWLVCTAMTSPVSPGKATRKPTRGPSMSRLIPIRDAAQNVVQARKIEVEDFDSTFPFFEMAVQPVFASRVVFDLAPPRQDVVRTFLVSLLSGGKCLAGIHEYYADNRKPYAASHFLFKGLRDGKLPSAQNGCFARYDLEETMGMRGIRVGRDVPQGSLGVDDGMKYIRTEFCEEMETQGVHSRTRSPSVDRATAELETRASSLATARHMPNVAKGAEVWPPTASFSTAPSACATDTTATGIAPGRAEEFRIRRNALTKSFAGISQILMNACSGIFQTRHTVHLNVTGYGGVALPELSGRRASVWSLARCRKTRLLEMELLLEYGLAGMGPRCAGYLLQDRKRVENRPHSRGDATEKRVAHDEHLRGKSTGRQKKRGNKLRGAVLKKSHAVPTHDRRTDEPDEESEREPIDDDDEVGSRNVVSRPTAAPSLKPAPQNSVDGQGETGSFACIACESMYASFDDLECHYGKKHSDLRLVICPECGAKFGNRSNRSRHISTVHRGLKPFVCTHPGCSSAFSQKSDLGRHAKGHVRRTATDVPAVSNVDIPEHPDG